MAETKQSPSATDLDVENKGAPEIQSVPSGFGHGIVEQHEENDLSRSLSQRHIQMIALAGAIVSEMKTFKFPRDHPAHPSRVPDSSSV